MATTDLAPRNGTDADVIERVIADGDLAQLTPAQRMVHYRNTCESLHLNPLTQPFQYLRLNGKLVLYARRDATDQLRKLNGVSIEPPHIQTINDCYVVTVTARDTTGRTDSDVGVVSIAGLRGEALGNALMKSITKAKRRVTLSICGLGLSDESEVETIPNAQPVQVDPRTGVVVEPLSRQALGYVEAFLPVDAPSAEYVKDFEADRDIEQDAGPPVCADCAKPIKRVRLKDTGEVLEAEEIRQRSLKTFGRVLCAVCAGTEAATLKRQLAEQTQESTY